MPELTTTILPAIDDRPDAYDELFREYINERILVFNNEVTDDMVEDIVMYILKWNSDDKDLPIDKRKKIKLYISSVGGDSFVAQNVVDVIINSKTPIIGVGLSLVASAAFHIYIACHERVAFKNSIFLMHDGSITISNSSKKAADTFAFIQSTEERTKQHVLNRTKMEPDFYDKVFDTEFYMYADGRAKELGVVDKIIGDDVDVDYIL